MPRKSSRLGAPSPTDWVVPMFILACVITTVLAFASIVEPLMRLLDH